jgi:hypothetical protein
MPNPRSTGEVLRRRFNERWQPDENGCHVWTGHRNSAGYGLINANGKLERAHRVAYELAFGAIPGDTDEDIVVRHKCDNRPCVNPDHLELGSRGDNNRDTAERGRHWCQQKTHCPQGHPLSGDNVYLSPSSGRVCRTCSDAAKRAYKERKRQEKGTKPRLTAVQIDAICEEYARGGITQRELGLKYGIAQGWVSILIKRRRAA